ncbi:Type II secretion system protein HxcR, partial [Durusdinium trenchii]
MRERAHPKPGDAGAIAEAIDSAYAGAAQSTSTEDDLGDAIVIEGPEAELERALAEADRDLLSTSGKAPVVRLVDWMLFHAATHGASDVHVQPLEDRVLVRMRIDGALRDVKSLPGELGGPVASRLKVVGRMDVAERRVPQDGRATVTIGVGESARTIDLRLSSLPTAFGERLVVRLLEPDGALDLDNFSGLGMPPEVEERWLAVCSRSSGIVLSTGPTGSGKTTTLYGTLSWTAKRSARDLNVMTIEDPIEYDLSGPHVAISQAQINTKKGVTFASGLRHILRQDPDVVMVGEIRDLETAQVAIQASLTGHLVLSTLHTSDSATAVTRLVDLGVEPYLVSASLSAALAQRLVRRVHQACDGKGCESCYGSGLLGRIGLFELLVVSEPIRERIAAGITASALRKAAREAGMRTLQDEGRRFVESGVTTPLEVARVASVGDDGFNATGIADTDVSARASLRRIGLTVLDVRPVVDQSEPLADAFEQHDGWFDAAEVAVVRTGQARGELAHALRSLSDRYARAGELAGKLASALAYPAIVSVAGVAVVVFLALGPLPRLVDILEQAGVQPPALTSAVISTGESIARGWAIMLAGAVMVLVFGAWAVLAISTQGRGWPDPLRRLVPQALRGMALARLASELQSMTRRGVPLTDALRASARTFNGPVAMSLRRQLELAATRVEAGERLSNALDDPHWFADDMRRLIDAGESAGELPDLLERLADRLERRATRLTDRLAGLIEPMAIILLASMIGVVVLSAVLPLLKLREVLAVVVLLGILAATLTVGLTAAFGQGKRELARTAIAGAKAKVEMYHVSEGNWPESLQDLVDAPPSASYHLPADAARDPWGSMMQLVVPGPQGQPFEIISLGGDGRVGGAGENADLSS